MSQRDREPAVDSVGALLRLNSSDNAAVALRDLERDEVCATPDGEFVTVAEHIPAGHKIALVDIPASGKVLKYGVEIGTATTPINAGSHVHVHNVASERMRGDR